MILIPQDEINHLSDRTCLVQGSVKIVNRNGFRELLSMEPVALSIATVDELSGGSTIYEGVDRLHFSCISGFKLNLQFKEVELSSADAMTSLDGSCCSHFWCLFQAISWNNDQVFRYRILHVYRWFNCFINRACR